MLPWAWELCRGAWGWLVALGLGVVRGRGWAAGGEGLGGFWCGACEARLEAAAVGRVLDAHEEEDGGWRAGPG